MRVSGSPEVRIVGHVQVRVASQVVSVPVQAGPIGESARPGFFSEAAGRFGILVDSAAPEAEQRQAIERASVEAAAFFSRKFLN